MRTKWMMSASAIGMGALGLVATFLPQEIVAAHSSAAGAAAASREAVLLVQVAGALYLAFAMLNWSVREMVIGGIYNRPVVMANLLHFIVVGLSLARTVADGERQPWILLATALYLLFAAWFGRTMMTSPAARTSSSGRADGPGRDSN
jgi:hypothetical protein